MKILIVMGGFFPGKKYGGPPVSVDNFCTLMKEYKCYIVCLNHDMGENEKYTSIHGGWNDRNNCKVLYVSNRDYNKEKFESVIEEIEPDMLYLQGLFQSCVLPCLQLAKKYCIPVLLAPRGELCAGAFSIRKWKKIPYIKALHIMGLAKNIYWQSTSEEETEAIKKLMKISDDHIHRLDNIPSIPKKNDRKQEKVVGEGKFIFLSRIHPKKNLLFAITLFREIEGKITFDIYGPIEDEEYWKHCHEEIKRLPSNVVVEYKGLVEHNQVHNIFSQYDAFLFPTLSENYGHVIAESLIVGTPVIISDQTPWKDLKKYGAGLDAPLSESVAFINEINRIVKMDETEYSMMISDVFVYINRKMNIQTLNKQYLKAITETIR